MLSFGFEMIHLTNREKCLVGALLLSILVGVTVRHYRHLGVAAHLPNGSQRAAAVAEPER